MYVNMSEITLPAHIADIPSQLVQGGPERIVAAAREINSSIPDAPDVVRVMMNRGNGASAANLLLSLSGHGLTIRQFYPNRTRGCPSAELVNQCNFRQVNGSPSEEDFAWLQRQDGKIVAELASERTFAQVTPSLARRLGAWSLIMLTPRVVPSTGVIIRAR